MCLHLNFNTFESLIRSFGYLSGIRFVLKNYVILNHFYCSKICDFFNEDTFVRTAPLQEVCILLKTNNSMSLGKGLPYKSILLRLTTKFYFQNQPLKYRVDGYKFRSV